MTMTRAQWGARYANGSGIVAEPGTEVWLHHSVTTAPARTLAAEAAAMRELEDIGQQRFGAGISYNRGVPPSGRIHEGVSWNRRGTHTGGRNTVARAYVLIGNYDVQQVTPEQIDGIARDLIAAHKAGHIDAPRLDGGHRDAPGASTACPGRYGMAAIPLVNARVTTLLTPEDVMTPTQEAKLNRAITLIEALPRNVWAERFDQFADPALQGGFRKDGTRMAAGAYGPRWLEGANVKMDILTAQIREIAGLVNDLTAEVGDMRERLEALHSSVAPA